MESLEKIKKILKKIDSEKSVEEQIEIIEQLYETETDEGKMYFTGYMSGLVNALESMGETIKKWSKFLAEI